MHSATGGEEPKLLTRYKCPGCDRTYTATSGIINHLKEAKHSPVAGEITEESTKVRCMQIGRNFVVVPDQPRPHGRMIIGQSSWTAAMGFDQPLHSVSAAADGDWMGKADPLLHTDDGIVPPVPSSIWRDSKRWVPAVSAFLTEVNQRIPKATVSEKSLLCSDKFFCVVQSAPSKYSANIALLLQHEYADQVDVSIASVKSNMTALLTDSNPSRKKTGRIIRFFSAILKGLNEFRNPNTFQFCLTHIKHALKGVALVRFQENKTNAKFDEDFAGKYLTSTACTMSDLQNWKRIARRCFQPEKDEKIRWTIDPGVFFHLHIPDSSNQTVNTHTKNIMSFTPQVLFKYASTSMMTRGLVCHSQITLDLFIQSLRKPSMKCGSWERDC
jgi:hypothetical protein